MQHSTSLRLTAALLAVTTLSACGDSAGSTAPDGANVSASVTQAVTLDVATVAGDAATEDVQTFRVNSGAFGIAQAIDFERFSRWDPCPLDATTTRFVCAERTRGPFTYNRSYAYADAAGIAQTAYSATTTAAANFKWSLSGTITRERWNGSMSRNRDITLSGLQGANSAVTVNGTGSGERQRTTFVGDSGVATGLTRSYEMQSSLAIANVVTSAIQLPDAYPLSGTVTRNYTVTRTGAVNGETTFTRNSVVTFNGTRLVSLVVNGKEFTLDLVTGKVAPKVTT
jgi:hypothetical protein